MLEKVSAKKKLLILTDPKFYEIFRRYSEGKISKEIEIVLLPYRKDAQKSSVIKTMSSQATLEKPKKTDFGISGLN